MSYLMQRFIFIKLLWSQILEEEKKRKRQTNLMYLIKKLN